MNDFQILDNSKVRQRGFAELFSLLTERNGSSRDERLSPFVNSMSREFVERKIRETEEYRSRSANVVEITMQELLRSAAQRDNLESFKSGDSACVVTGQQVGFLGGPLYTFYKAQSVVALAKKLSNELQRHIVPIFWVEDNDHDFDEGTTTAIYSSDGSLDTLNASIQDSIERKKNQSCLNALTFSGDIANQLTRINTSLYGNGFQEETMDLLSASLRAGASLTSSFTHILQSIFRESGLLFFNASVARNQGLFAPVVQSELENLGRTKELIATTSRDLSRAGFTVDFDASDVNVFAHQGDSRYRIHQSESGFRVHNRSISHQDLLSEFHHRPNEYSGSVALRPIIQDAILPNLAYVAGPGETQYLLHLKTAASAFGVSQSLIYPRHSATYIDTKRVELLDKTSTSIDDHFSSFSRIEENYLSSVEGNSILADVVSRRKTLVEEVLIEVRKIVPPSAQLLTATEVFNAGLRKPFEKLERKIRKTLKRNEETQLSRIQTIHNLVFPKDGLQERILSPIHLLSSLGLERTREYLEYVVAGSVADHPTILIDPTSTE